ncbi:MAG: insulinase family protein, partial [Bacteroidaceae bacterium]
FSYEASKFAIANEYDKMMAGIGSTGSNAYTSTDVTCYQENIPCHALEPWAMVQSERFRNMVIRGFHTELEAVYEEFNMSLTNDFEKMNNALYAILFPHHPYGTQTTIGTQQHLKNPSLRNVMQYYREWYVPNNVAICMSGDLDPDETIRVIEKYFGDWQPSDSLPKRTFPQEKPLEAPVYVDVVGMESPKVALGWRLPAKADPQYGIIEVAKQILSNGKCGLFDQNLNNAQQVMQAVTFSDGMTDQSALWAIGWPKEGQSLEEVRDLMLEQVRLLAGGEWDESLLKAILNNMKRRQLEDMQSNEMRASRFVDAFVSGQSWSDAVGEMQRLDTLTKKTVVDCVRRLLTEGYGCVYKRQGVDTSAQKIDKPKISPIETNRDQSSHFVDSVLKMPVADVEPVFVDFSREVQTGKLTGGNELISHRDVSSRLFSLTFVIERGTKEDPALAVAEQYMPYLGTDSLSAAELQSRLYALACDVSLSMGDGRTRLSISGLAENMEEALRLAEDWIATAQPDSNVYAQVVNDILKQRSDSKVNQKSCFHALSLYGIYGPRNVLTDALDAEQMRQLGASGVLEHLRSLSGYAQRALYYGPLETNQVCRMLNQLHPMSQNPVAAHDSQFYTPLRVDQNQVIMAPYQAKNTHMMGYSCR